jgi:hypothetical protein
MLHKNIAGRAFLRLSGLIGLLLLLGLMACFATTG